MEGSACLDEYLKFVNGMNTPRVVIDNAVNSSATVVKVNSSGKHNILLQAVQFLTDLDLTIKKGYVSSDGQWFMDVFYVTDVHGHKVTDPAVLSLIEKSLAVGDKCSFAGLTAIELTGSDRPGLLSEVFAVLNDLDCNVMEARVWTHNDRIASLIFVEDLSISEDFERVKSIEKRLCHVLKGDNDLRSARTVVALPSVTHVDRRLHQLMFDDRDYARVCSGSESLHQLCAICLKKSSVTVQNWDERGYSIVSVQCRDRPKLLFDIVCTLMDMQYVVFHGTFKTDGDSFYQEFYIRHIDGTPISSEAEQQRVIQCLQAAIERRAAEGLRLELCTTDRLGLLADVTRTFRENGLSITRADISTRCGTAVNVFYVIGTAGNLPDRRIIDSVIERIGVERLKLNEEPPTLSCNSGVVRLFSLGNLVKRNLSYLGLIRSCS